MKTIANFWPYATTLFDFIRRGMPWTQPRSLTDDEVYALTAFILAKNRLIGDTDMMNTELAQSEDAEIATASSFVSQTRFEL